MSDPAATDPENTESRADALTAEEREAGIDDPASLAEAVLAESEERKLNREGTTVERRRSEDTVDTTG
jgi:hypothetical protein